ncbi:N-terminal delta endotoxin domain-containing protein [Heterostelium album PN500]|uniref:N-terminal delta endotoxin domain-containing protein n=1 Tax=Heterostelium pallidum (strain ATCC 26659 / Pp 5 / PN500) TaxID=670386 RepID=D3B041_HETP5|nr:N-terminal delta endotoxin domain-containing protein [Heterostelium album PN500]EFA84665.1 N-terminal delta endotoxin domain-containing protein [Heterostelium album PN500]|eukprot:XP_020436778.1 N-terminal delta endotoxin domain-containing protein [Heterostelium album PN500]
MEAKNSEIVAQELPVQKLDELTLINVKSEENLETTGDVQDLLIPTPSRSRIMNIIGDIISGMLGNIPVIGVVAAALFNDLWSRAFTTNDSGSGNVGPQFVTEATFLQHMAEFRVEMENLIRQTLENHIIQTSNHMFRVMKTTCDRYHRAVVWYERIHNSDWSNLSDEQIPSYLKEDGVPGPVPTNDSANNMRLEIRTSHALAKTEIERCLDYFLTVGASVTQRQIMVGHIVQTALFYILMQRDIFFKGREWGFPSHIIAAVPDGIENVIDKSFFGFANYATPFASSIISRQTTPDLYMMYSSFAYLDLKRFPGGSLHLNINERDWVCQIPRFYDNAPSFKFVVNHFFARILSGPATWPVNRQGAILDGVYNVDYRGQTAQSFIINRASRPYNRIILFINFNGPTLAPRIRVLIDGVVHFPISRIAPCKEITFYANLRPSNYFVFDVRYNIGRHSTIVQIDGLIQNETTNHTVVQFP